MNFISFIGIITVFFGATLALAQKDIKRGLAYSTMSQLGYMMLALGMGSYRSALFHLITHAYSKALLFLGSGSVIHSMETLVGYCPKKSQNMVLMGGLKKHVPITKNSFLLGTLSLCGIPPLACFWSKDEILNDSWLYSPIFAIIAWSTAGFTAFYMCRIYLLTFEGHLNVHFQNYSGKRNTPLYSISLWGKEGSKISNKNLNFCLVTLLKMNKNGRPSFFSNKVYKMDENGRNLIQPFLSIPNFSNTKTSLYPYESDNTMLFPILILILFTLFVGFLGILSIKMWIYYPNDWYEFCKDAVFSVSIACFGIYIAFFLYKPVYSSFQNLDLINSVVKMGPKRIFSDKIKNAIYDWSYNRGYIDAFYGTFFTAGVRKLAEFTHFFDRRIIDGIPNGVGFMSFFVAEVIKSVGVDAFLLICSFIFLMYQSFY
ncbi:NAD(P)H-quinone oxidoreductase subunit 5 [Helianthus debilis subsp. tardiflorus]